jgi:endonuclease YncB( thermonuclease family)
LGVEIVDGDTIDVNNVRIRLSMVDAPEREEVGYGEATKTVESICPVSSNALVDEDDGQKERSYDRVIGVVYCNSNARSVNQVLIEDGKATVYEDFCNVSDRRVSETMGTRMRMDPEKWSVLPIYSYIIF